MQYFCVGYETYSVTTDGHGIFNVRTHKLGLRAIHTKGGSRHKRVWTRVDSEGQKNSIPCPTRGSNPASSYYLNSELTNH